MATAPYRVLARAYRPKILADLRGQDALVKTLTYALTSGHIAHAYLLTGIRGVGKTTTARIIARALLCVGKDGKSDMTPTPCGECPQCEALDEDRHPDVIEMDAASHTGVQDIRDLIDTVHYRPVLGRRKIVILDEVHMLSTSAFNALLKTLEEPPEHLCFIFATTESRKIPMTIRSRCQHFSLHRLTIDDLALHLSVVSEKEKVKLAPEAARLLAECAGGSVRDSLSLLDQAIAFSCHGKQKEIEEAKLREMLGLADHSQLVVLLQCVFEGNAKGAIEQVRELYKQGFDGMILLDALQRLVHIASCEVAQVPSGSQASEKEREALRELSSHFSVPVLTRLWQMILKGQQELRQTDHMLMALEMLMVRMAFAADLPTFDQMKKMASQPAIQEASTSSSGPIQSFDDIVQLCRKKQEMRLYHHLREDAHLVSYHPGKLVLRLKDVVPEQFVSMLRQKLREWTEQPWQVDVSKESGSETLKSQADQVVEAKKEQAAETPSVKSVLEAFPGAEVTAVNSDKK